MADTALARIAGPPPSNLIVPSKVTSRHKASERLEEKRIQEQTDQFHSVHGDGPSSPEDSIGFGQAQASREWWEDYAHAINDHKNIPFYDLTRNNLKRWRVQQAKRALQEVNIKLSSIGQSRSRINSRASSCVSIDTVSTYAESDSPTNSSLEAMHISDRVHDWLKGSSASPQPDGGVAQTRVSDIVLGSKHIKLNVTAGLGQGETVAYRIGERLSSFYKIKVICSNFITKLEYAGKALALSNMCSNLHHPNIVPFYGVIECEDGIWSEISMFCPGGDLFDSIKQGRMSELEIRCCFKQLCNGVAYLHSMGIAHKSLRPESLFFDERGYLKIGDFRCSTRVLAAPGIDEGISIRLRGAEHYLAPEAFLGNVHDARTLDVWAVGIIYYTMVRRKFPWKTAQRQTTEFKSYVISRDANDILARESESLSGSVWPLNDFSPPACRFIVNAILHPNPHRRAGMENVRADEWFRQIAICGIEEHPKHKHDHANKLASRALEEFRDNSDFHQGW